MIFITHHVKPKKNQSYKLKFKARGDGEIWTYVYGNNYKGIYIDNGHPWQLTDEWKNFDQEIPIDSVPITNAGEDGFLVDIRTFKGAKGEITDIEFIPI